MMTTAATVHRRRTVARALSAMVEPPSVPDGTTGPANRTRPAKDGPLRGSIAGRDRRRDANKSAYPG